MLGRLIGMGGLRTMSACSVVVLAIGGCSSEPTALPCTALGGIDGIGVDFSEIRSAHPNERLVVDACVADECQTTTSLPGDRGSGIRVGDEAITDDSPVSVTLTISADDSVLFDDQLMVQPGKGLPNGPGCSPTTWSTQLRATGQGELALSETP